jgi:AraC-like DNA-binding protein
MGRNLYLLSEQITRLVASPQTTEASGRILVVDDAGGAYCQSLIDSLPNCHFVLESSPETARRSLLSPHLDLLMLSHSEHINCLEWLPLFKSLCPSVSIVVTAGCGCEQLAVQAFRCGAIDYFSKPFALREMEISIRAILEIRKRNKDCGELLSSGGLQRALNYIQSNFKAPISLGEAAREAGMSVSSFERYLKSQTGMTFIVYLNNIRIAQAKELLRADHTQMLQIALSCGFSNQSHFNRVFRKLEGVTPGEFRKMTRSGNYSAKNCLTRFLGVF